EFNFYTTYKSACCRRNSTILALCCIRYRQVWIDYSTRYQRNPAITQQSNRMARRNIQTHWTTGTILTSGFFRSAASSRLQGSIDQFDKSIYLRKKCLGCICRVYRSGKVCSHTVDCDTGNGRYDNTVATSIGRWVDTILSCNFI